MKKRIHLWLPVALCAALLLVAYAVKGLYPIGVKTILTRDLYQQGVPLLNNFRDTVTGQTDLFYNPKIYGGANNYPLALPDLLNPVNYLLLLFPRAMIPQAANVLLLAYIALSALTATLFFHRLFPKIGIWNTVFSMGYALSGYQLYMYQIFAWLPAVALFPILLLAFIRLLKTGKGGAFSLLLAWTIVLSFQLGAMTVLFLLFGGGLYVLRYLEKPKRAMAAWRIGAHTLLGIAVSGAFLIPYLLSLLTSMRSGTSVSFSIWNQLGLSELFDRVFMLFHPLTLSALALWLLGKRIHPREKRSVWPALCALLTLTSLINPWHEAWHLGTHVRFPVRFGYMAVLCALCALADSVLRRRERENRHPNLMRVAFSALMFLSLGLIFAKHEDFARGFETLSISKMASQDAILIAIAMGLLFLAGLIALTRENLRLRAGLAMILAIAFGVSMPLVCLYSERSLAAYGAMAELSQMDLAGSEFQRTVGIDQGSNKNAGLVANINTLGGYLPTGAPRAFRNALEAFGYDTAWVSTSSEGGTLFSDALLCGRWKIAPEADPLYEAMSTDQTPLGEVALYQMNCLPLGVLLDTSFPEDETYFDMQNAIYRALGGRGELFSRAKTTIADGKENARALQESAGYLVTDQSPDTIGVLRNGEPIPGFGQASSGGYAISLGLLHGGDEVSIVSKEQFKSSEIWLLNLDLYREFLGEWSDTPSFQVEGNRIRGAVSAYDGQMLLLQMAWHEDFSARVNGEQVKLMPVLGGLVGVPLEEGEQEIEITFFPRGLKPGLVLSLMAMAGLLLTSILRRRGEPIWLQKAALAGFVLALIAGGVIVYVLPIFRLILRYV